MCLGLTMGFLTACLAPHALPDRWLILPFLTKVWTYKVPHLIAHLQIHQHLNSSHIFLLGSAISFGFAFSTSSFLPNTPFHLLMSPPWSINFCYSSVQHSLSRHDESLSDSNQQPYDWVWLSQVNLSANTCPPQNFERDQDFLHSTAKEGFYPITSYPFELSMSIILLCYGLHFPLHFLFGF